MGSTVLVTRMGKVDSVVSMVIECPGSYSVTMKLESTSRPMNLALWSYVDPVPMGGSEVHRHETIPLCHFGLFEASAKNSNTSSAGRVIIRAALNLTSVNLSQVWARYRSVARAGYSEQIAEEWDPHDIECCQRDGSPGWAGGHEYRNSNRGYPGYEHGYRFTVPCRWTPET